MPYRIWNSLIGTCMVVPILMVNTDGRREKFMVTCEIVIPGQLDAALKIR